MIKLTRTAAAYALGIYLATGWRSGWNPGEWPQRERHGGGGSCGCTGPARTASETQGKHGRGKSPRNGKAVRKRAAFFVAYPP